MGIEKEISDVILSLADAIDKENEEESQEIIQKLLSNRMLDWKDPDNINVMYFYQGSKHIQPLLKRVYPELNNQLLNKVCFIYENYQFICNNIRPLVDLGYGCGSDKVRWTIHQYLKKCLGKTLPEIPERNSRFHHYGQPDFGTIDDWMNFIEEIYMFYYRGYSDNFKNAYDVLYTKREQVMLVFKEEVRRINVFYNALPYKIEELINLKKIDESSVKNMSNISLMEKLKQKVADNNCSDDDIVSAINETEE